MATKVTSMNDSSGNPTPPIGTPVTDFMSEVAPMSSPHLKAVDKILVPIQESLNEEAENAAYPSPPINTPQTYSPAPSVIIRQFQRTRGMSALGERLMRINVDQRSIQGLKDKEMDSRSECFSNGDEAEGSNAGEDSGISPTGEIPIGLGSPTTNPRLQEYLAHAPSGSRFPTKDRTPRRDGDDGKNGKNGVVEKSNWAEDVMGDLEHAFMRLQQLAEDEEDVDGIPAKVHYLERLNQVVTSTDRKFPTTTLHLAE